eukprot:scaffold224112_cov30-Tisochrysis_lutea.AAC.3
MPSSLAHSLNGMSSGTTYHSWCIRADSSRTSRRLRFTGMSSLVSFLSTVSWESFGIRAAFKKMRSNSGTPNRVASSPRVSSPCSTRCVTCAEATGSLLAGGAFALRFVPPPALPPRASLLLGRHSPSSSPSPSPLSSRLRIVTAPTRTKPIRS